MPLIKRILFLSISFLILLQGGLSFANGSNSEDLLQQAFGPAIDADQLVGKDMIGTTKYSVGHYVLEGGTVIDLSHLSDDEKDLIYKRNSLIVQITKFLVRITLILSITMIIYNGIIFVIKSSKGEPPKEIFQNLLYICIGILLALGSVVLINLSNSIGVTVSNFEGGVSFVSSLNEFIS